MRKEKENHLSDHIKDLMANFFLICKHTVKNVIIMIIWGKEELIIKQHTNNLKYF
jgi:hypothetical protein